ncbi:Ion channel [Trichostrongylus colubriformis]|uniref:Ion channel n=1 Tax=Trichostrongylus colubriformis TaxID=6319 RepID=A0AAN8G481_TRICO
MSTGDLPPRFQLALRRSLFFGICMCFWLLIGTLAFSLLSVVGQRRTDLAGMVKLDAKRTELLNVLWAETISKSEADWAEMANQKLELYEKALLNYLGYHDNSEDRSLMGSLQKSFSLSTTIGPMNIASFTTPGKAFAILYALIGVPLCLLFISQVGRMITSIWERTALMIPVLVFVFVSAIIYDIIEDGTDDVPFVDAIFSIFLQFSAIGEMDSEFHGFLPYTITIIGLSMMSAVFAQMQHELERSIHGPEFTFSKIFSKFERWMSEGKGSVNTNRIEEEDEEGSDY